MPPLFQVVLLSLHSSVVNRAKKSVSSLQVTVDFQIYHNKIWLFSLLFFAQGFTSLAWTCKLQMGRRGNCSTYIEWWFRIKKLKGSELCRSHSSSILLKKAVVRVAYLVQVQPNWMGLTSTGVSYTQRSFLSTVGPAGSAFVINVLFGEVSLNQCQFTM